MTSPRIIDFSRHQIGSISSPNEATVWLEWLNNDAWMPMLVKGPQVSSIGTLDYFVEIGNKGWLGLALANVADALKVCRYESISCR